MISCTVLMDFYSRGFVQDFVSYVDSHFMDLLGQAWTDHVKKKKKIFKSTRQSTMT